MNGRRVTGAAPRWLGAVTLACGVAFLAAWPASAARFSATTGNAGNSAQAATLASPSGLTTTMTCVPAATVAFGAASSGTNNGGLLTITKPAATVAGDLMVAQLGLRTSNSTVTAPAGWTLIRDDSAPTGGGIQSVLYYRVAAADEPTSFTWSSSANARIGGGILTYTGASTTAPVDVANGQVGSNSAARAPSVTATIAQSFLATFFVARQQAFASLPGGMSTRWNLDTSGGAGSVGVAASDEYRSTEGVTGNRDASAVAMDWIGQSVILRPSATPSMSLSWTATPSAFATGYKVQRWLGGSQQNQQTITPRTTTSATDSPAASTSYTYQIFAYHQSWTSTVVTKSVSTPAC